MPMASGLSQSETDRKTLPEVGSGLKALVWLFSTVESEFLLAAVFSLIWMTRMSPTWRGRRSSNSGR